MNENDDLEELDTSWLSDYNYETDENKEVDWYYKVPVEFIKIKLMYVSSTGEINKITETKCILTTPGVLHKEHLIQLIKSYSSINNVKYGLLYLIKFNINVDPEHLHNFLKSKDNTIAYQYLQPIKHIDDILYSNTITMFNDLNELIIIYQHKSLTNSNKLTRRHKHLITNQHHNITKKLT